jgi:hypothetical protein
LKSLSRYDGRGGYDYNTAYNDRYGYTE